MDNRTQFVPISPRPANGQEAAAADTHRTTTMISSTENDNRKNVAVRPLAATRHESAEHSAHGPRMTEVSIKLMGQSIKVITHQDYEHGVTRSYVGSNQFPPQHSAGGSSAGLQEANGGATHCIKRKRGGSSSSSGPDQAPDNKSRFPTSARQLLCTGIYEGVPVMYSGWKRERTLRATIQGCLYKCSCDSCVRTNAEPVSALALQKHAGGGSLQPNKNIYFSNGKSVLAVVQELKEARPNELFAKMRTIIASPIDEIRFNAWKGIFLAQNPEYAESAENDETSSHATS